MFADLHCEILSHHSGNLISYKEFLKAIVSGASDENRIIIDSINELPGGDSVCHGDFHPGNILVKPDGMPVIIDFMNVCHGPYFYDIARTFFLLNRNDAFLAENYLTKMHVSKTDIIDYIEIINRCRKYETRGKLY